MSASATVGTAPRAFRRLAVTGMVATLAAAAATTLGAALSRAAGVDFEVAGGDTIPVSGVTVVTGFFSLVGVAIAGAFGRWSARPAEFFARTAWSLAGLSMVPPFLAGADPATTFTLVGLHLVAALVMIPTLVRSLRGG